MGSGFRAFLLKSNALALAIGVIIGTALGTVVTSLVDDIIMPPIGLLLGGIDFSQLEIVLKEATANEAAVAIRYGAFINVVIAFVIVAFVVYLLSKRLLPPDAPTATCPHCKETIAPDATRCKFCTSELSAS